MWKYRPVARCHCSDISPIDKQMFASGSLNRNKQGPCPHSSNALLCKQNQTLLAQICAFIDFDLICTELQKKCPHPQITPLPRQRCERPRQTRRLNRGEKCFAPGSDGRRGSARWRTERTWSLKRSDPPRLVGGGGRPNPKKIIA